MNEKTKKIVGIGLFTAIVVVLQLVASTIKFGPFSITLTAILIIDITIAIIPTQKSVQIITN